MIYVVTGQFGSGKTAYVIDQLVNDPQYKGRPLFCMGIPELKIDHSPVPPVDQWTEQRVSDEDPSVTLPYFTFPPNSVIVIDEAQRLFRPRAVGSKVPDEVQAFETHRHTGVDFFLITQHAGLLDSNIRKHKPRHIHIRVTWLGKYKYEWAELADPDKESDRELAVKTKYKPPRRVFDLYKSSDQHTVVKSRVPVYVYVFGIAAVSTVALGTYAYHRIQARVEASAIRPGVKDEAIGRTSSVQKSVSVPEYLEVRTPRLAGLAHTAPIYDEITKPVDAPYPVGCVATTKRCRCVDQQGNDYITTDPICRQIVDKGMFKEWGKPEPVSTVTGTAQPAPAAVMTVPISPPSINPV